MKTTWLVFFLLCAKLAHSQLTVPQQNEFVSQHNLRRRQVQPPALNMQTMSWSPCLASLAQVTANKCQRAHSTLGYRTNKCGFRYVGENWAYGWGTPSYAPNAGGPTRVVTLWDAEKAYYSYNTNTCARGRVCGHYTQVVWHNSYKLGCGYRSCSFGHYYVCNYGNGGNIMGQRPYNRRVLKRSEGERQVPCSVGCGPNSRCDNATDLCVCDFGYAILDNSTTCVRSESVFLNGFDPVRGNEDWAFVGDETSPSELGYSGGQTTEPNILKWVVGPGFTAANSVLGVQIRAEHNATEWGLCIGIQSPNEMVCFVYSTVSKEVITSVYHEGKEIRKSLDMPYDWPISKDPEVSSPFVSFSITMKGNYSTVNIDGKQVGKAVYMPFLKPNGGAALRASSIVSFANLFMTTTRNLIMTLVGCLTEQEFATRVAAILGVDPSQVTNIKIEGGNCSPSSSDLSRQTVSVTFSLVGDSIDTADSLVSNLRSKVTNKDPSLAQHSLQVQKLDDDVEEASPTEVVEFSPKSSRFTAGTTAGIVFGCIIGVATLGVAVILAVQYKLRKDAHQQKTDESATT